MKKNEHPIHYTACGEQDAPPVLWAHGWGQTGKSFAPLITSVEKLGRHIAIDFPGFGDSPLPPNVWGTAEYADALAKFIQEYIDGKVIWVGHSFGCRVGLQMAIRHPDLIKGLFLIGGAGLRRKRNPAENAWLHTKIYTFKGLKKLIPLGLVNEDWLKSKFGSADYRNAGPIRPIMVRVNQEDLSDIVPQIKCPVHLVYGENDTETPPEIGQRLNKLIEGSQLDILPDQDHYTVLNAGRHQVAPLLKNFITSLRKS